MARKALESLPFEIEARVPLQLGRENISNSLVAVLEVVKNAYDADATEVAIKFIRKSKNKIDLIIADNGHGMSLHDVKTSWLKIGSRKKTDILRSPIRKRVLTGAKGLGRLGLDRLASSLNLYTKTKSMGRLIEVDVDWTRFERPNTVLSSVKNKTYEIDLPSVDPIISEFFNVKSDSGTLIFLPELRDEWNEEYLDRLKQQLSYLVSPFGGIDDFQITIETFGDTKQTLSAADYIDEAHVKVEANLVKKQKKYYVNMRVVDRSGKNISQPWKSVEWSEFVSLDVPKQAVCGPLNVKLYYYTLNKSAFFENIPSLSARKYLKSNYGVRIYRDDVRVLPYGEPSGTGDWLNLGERAQRSPGGMAQGGWRVNLYQLIGSVDIGRKQNPDLVDQTNREGLQESTALYDLEKFILAVIE